jgi:hypothetical protein
LVDVDGAIVGEYSIQSGFQACQGALDNLTWAGFGLGDARGHVGIDVPGIDARDACSLRTQKTRA